MTKSRLKILTTGGSPGLDLGELSTSQELTCNPPPHSALSDGMSVAGTRQCMDVEAWMHDTEAWTWVHGRGCMDA